MVRERCPLFGHLCRWVLHSGVAIVGGGGRGGGVGERGEGAVGEGGRGWRGRGELIAANQVKTHRVVP